MPMLKANGGSQTWIALMSPSLLRLLTVHSVSGVPTATVHTQTRYGFP